MSVTADEISGLIRATMEADNTSPDEAVTALGHSLTTALMAICETSDWSLDVCQATLDFLTKIQQQLQKAINEHTPKDTTFLSLDEVKARVEELSVNPKQADTNARVNACKQIMETDTLGFLLLSYLRDGNVSMCSNLQDSEKRDKVLVLLRETLYGEGEGKFKM